MKLEVFECKSAEPEPLRLRLKEVSESEVELVVVNSIGQERHGGSLLSISSCGIYRFSGVDSKLGFNLVKDGKLDIEN